MRDVRCLFGKHIYSQAQTELSVEEKTKAFFKCKVRSICVRCEKAREDIVYIPIPYWLEVKDEEEWKGGD